MDFDLVTVRGQVEVDRRRRRRAQRQHRRRGPGSPRWCAPQHEKVVDLRQPGRSARAPRRCRRRPRATRTPPIIDFINLRAGRHGEGGAGRHRRTRACRCSRSPRRSTGRARIPAGQVTMRDVAGLYIYDNTLLGSHAHRRPGQGLPGVLGAATSSRSAAPDRSRSIRRDQRGHADRAERHPGLQLRHHGRPRRRPHLRHRHLASRPGSRITNLSYAGAPVDPAASSSSSRSTTTASPAAATSRTSRPRRSSTTAQSRSAS